MQAFAQDDRYVYDPEYGTNSWIRDDDDHKALIGGLLLQYVVHWANDLKSSPDPATLAVCFDAMLQARAFISQRNQVPMNEREKRLSSTINKLLEPFSLSYHKKGERALFDMLKSSAYSRRVEDFKKSINLLVVTLDDDK